MFDKKWFYKLNQTVDHDFVFTDMDFSWLKSLGSDAYCLMNIASQHHSCPAVPDGKDLYVLSWFFEPFDDVWFINLYNRNPGAEFVVISDMNPHDFKNFDRVTYFQMIHHSTWINTVVQQNTRPVNTDLSRRRYKLSSLSSRLNEFKFYVTAKLKSVNSNDVFYTWNRGFEIRSADSFVFEPRGLCHTDKMLEFAEYLKTNTINAETFDNNPTNGSCFAHPAFLDTVINSVNETQSMSQTPEFGRLPTPYITEKTWKPLFAGNALLFTGQAGLKKQLESWGFRFDYIWAQNIDENAFDNVRLEVLLNQIDWILATPLESLAQQAQHSVDHNLELAWSGKLQKMFREHNNATMEHIKKYVCSK